MALEVHIIVQRLKALKKRTKSVNQNFLHQSLILDHFEEDIDAYTNESWRNKC
jgi:hypothetical protein